MPFAMKYTVNIFIGHMNQEIYDHVYSSYTVDCVLIHSFARYVVPMTLRLPGPFVFLMHIREPAWAKKGRKFATTARCFRKMDTDPRTHGCSISRSLKTSRMS